MSRTLNATQLLESLNAAKANVARSILNEIRGDCAPSKQVANALVEYYRDLTKPHIATNVIKAVGFHGDYQHFPFFLEVIRKLAPISQDRNGEYAIESAIACAGRVGMPNDIEALWLTGAPPMVHDLARAFTMMLVKQDGRGLDSLEADYSHRIDAFRSSFGIGSKGIIAETSARLGAIAGERQQVLVRVLEEMRFRLVDLKGVIGFSFHPGFHKNQPNEFDQRRAAFAKNPVFCELCGRALTSVTATVFERFRICPKCIFRKLRQWLIDSCGISPDAWCEPPKDSPVSVQKRSDGPSMLSHGYSSEWPSGTIASYDNALQSTAHFGPGMHTWHNLMGRHHEDLERHDSASGLEIRLKCQRPRIWHELDAWLLFTLWEGEFALRHEPETKWRGEEACLRIVAELLGEQPQRQWTADWLVNPSSGSKLFIDGFFPRYRLAVEHQGLQHFEPVEIFGGTAAFTDLQQRDSAKRALLVKYGVKLLEVRYDEVSRDEIAMMLTQACVL